MENLTLKDLAIDHDYYCSDNNYYSNDAALKYETFNDFLADFKDADVDMNLVFRWDVKAINDEDETEGYYLEIFQMKQRKGIYTPIHISEFKKEDIAKLIEYLQPHIAKLKSIWKPFEF